MTKLIRATPTAYALYSTDTPISTILVPSDVSVFADAMWQTMIAISTAKRTEAAMLALYSQLLGLPVQATAGLPSDVKGGHTALERLTLTDTGLAYELDTFSADTSAVSARSAAVVAVLTAELWAVIVGLFQQQTGAADEFEVLVHLSDVLGKPILDAREPA